MKQCEPGSVLITGLPRSGSTWLFNAARLLLHAGATADASGAGCVAAGSVLKTHDPDDSLAARVRLRLHSSRDLRAIVASAWAKGWCTSVDDALELGRRVVQMHEYWLLLADHHVEYESMMVAPDRALRELAGRLELQFDEGGLDSIQSRLESMPTPPTGAAPDPVTKLHPGHRCGVGTRWRELLPTDLVEALTPLAEAAGLARGDVGLGEDVDTSVLTDNREAMLEIARRERDDLRTRYLEGLNDIARLEDRTQQLERVRDEALAASSRDRNLALHHEMARDEALARAARLESEADQLRRDARNLLDSQQQTHDQAQAGRAAFSEVEESLRGQIGTLESLVGTLEAELAQLRNRDVEGQSIRDFIERARDDALARASKAEHLVTWHQRGRDEALARASKAEHLVEWRERERDEALARASKAEHLVEWHRAELEQQSDPVLETADTE